MNSPASVMGCNSCGALYQAAPGDKGVCEECRKLLPPDPSWRSGGASPGGAGPKPSSAPSAKPSTLSPKPAGQPVASIAKRPAAAFSAQRPNFYRGRALRRIVIAAGCALAVAGGGAWLATHQRSFADLQRAIRRHSPSDAWTAVQRHASKAWVAIQRQIDELQGKRSGSAASATSSRMAVRDAPASHSTHRRGQLSVAPKKKGAKQSKDDISVAGNTP